MISRRILDLSSNKDIFEALKASGYNNELQYTEKTCRQEEISEDKCDLVKPAVE